MTEFLQSNSDLLIGVFLTIAGWILGIVTRPFLDKFFVDKPRVNITTRFRSDQAVRDFGGHIITRVRVTNAIQSHSVHDIFGFEILNVEHEKNDAVTLEFNRLPSPVLIDRSNTFYYNYDLLIRLDRIKGDYRYFDYSIPALKLQLPLSQTIRFRYKNAHGRVFTKNHVVNITPEDEIEEGIWVH